jgi:WXG100 family type VII secretion target
MPAAVIKAEYDSLEEIAKKFIEHADDTQNMFQSLGQTISQLEGGGWIGLGAQAFYEEISDLVNPALQRLNDALQDASSATGRISQAFADAEDEAARLFNGAGAIGEAPGGGGGNGGPGGEAPGSGGNGPREAFTYPDYKNPQWKVNLADPAQVDKIINPNLKGADTPELNQTMRQLNEIFTGKRPQSELDATLNKLAEIRGESPDKMRADYEQFKKIHADMTARVGGTDKFPSSLAEDSSISKRLGLATGNDFWGKTDQLRFGAVVGDSFGIDPVFGSMLSPTGGLIGPGDMFLDPAMRGLDSVRIHGAVHDAAGFMYNAFDKAGPGYHYSPHTWEFFDKGNPLAGQTDGIEFWVRELNKRGM